MVYPNDATSLCPSDLYRGGICTYEDGAVYTGEWCQDQRSGWGKHTFSNKEWYEGEWEDDTMQGQGRLMLLDGAYYECSWQAGQPQKGRWSSADGQTEYEGQFKGMLWHGFGTLHQTGVRKYMGKVDCEVQQELFLSMKPKNAVGAMIHDPRVAALHSSLHVAASRGHASPEEVMSVMQPCKGHASCAAL